MGRGVIVVYRPKLGKEDALLQLVKDHVSILRIQQLATDRTPVIMKTADGCIVEIFEWTSAESIQEAHHNTAVQELWKKFNEICTYESPADLKEFQGPFSEFEIIPEH